MKIHEEGSEEVDRKPRVYGGVEPLGLFSPETRDRIEKLRDQMGELVKEFHEVSEECLKEFREGGEPEAEDEMILQDELDRIVDKDVREGTTRPIGFEPVLAEHLTKVTPGDYTIIKIFSWLLWGFGSDEWADGAPQMHEVKPWC